MTDRLFSRKRVRYASNSFDCALLLLNSVRGTSGLVVAAPSGVLVQRGAGGRDRLTPSPKGEDLDPALQFLFERTIGHAIDNLHHMRNPAHRTDNFALDCVGEIAMLAGYLAGTPESGAQPNPVNISSPQRTS